VRTFKASIVRAGERYFGVEVSDAGVVVAERHEGRACGLTRYPATQEGAQALRRHVADASPHPHVCIKSCGAALMLATALAPVPGVEVTLVASRALQRGPAASAEEGAAQLARLAERLF